ncbi:MAG: hypothetical protein QNJ60_05310 [Xenococcaceae cyanobacterium MO_188.B19]|nr:hypothetical protein [Xenococcaceae cyanobacterium MO_188.B19]
MARTSFERQDAEDLLNQLKQYHETQRQEWSSVLNQWKNLESVWLDKQYEKFEPLFDKLSSTYSEAEKDCEKYMDFIQKQIQIDDQRKQKLASGLADL